MEEVLDVIIILRNFSENAFLTIPDEAKLTLLLKLLRNNPAFTDASNPIMRDSEEINDAIVRNNLICISF